MKDKKSTIIYVIPILLLFAVLTVTAWLLPLRPQSSPDEKRELKSFPDFSVQSLYSGKYFADIDAWFSDTFTFRNTWLSVSELVESMYGSSDIKIYGEYTSSDDVPTPSPSESLSPWDDVSEEDWKPKTVDGDDFVSFGTVVQIDDACYEYPYFYKSGANRFAAVISKAAEVAGDRAKVYSVLAPSSMGIQFDPDYLKSIGCADEEQVQQYIYGAMRNVGCVDSYNALKYHNSEYLYFRTDHHWTARAAYYAYREYCRTAKLSPADLNDFREMVFDGYKGSLWSYANRSHTLGVDTVYAYYPPGDIRTTITTSKGSTYSINIIVDMSDSYASSKYLCFLSGDNPFTEITNSSVQNGKTCLVIKDSFGNCFVPYLTQNYEHIYVVDYRSYKAMKLDGLIDKYSPDDIVFVNSVTVAQDDRTCANIEKLIGELK